MTVTRRTGEAARRTDGRGIWLSPPRLSGWDASCKSLFRIQEMINSNFKLYKQITDDPEFEKFFLGWLFEQYKRREEAVG